MKTIEAKVQWRGREEACLSIDLDDNENIVTAKLSGIGGSNFLRLLVRVRPTLLRVRFQDLPLPSGVTPEALCLREVILKAKGLWKFPYEQEELCHCRAVPTAVVDQAICVGAHTPRKVSQQTSASTACGTCSTDVEAIIEYRLGKK